MKDNYSLETYGSLIATLLVLSAIMFLVGNNPVIFIMLIGYGLASGYFGFSSYYDYRKSRQQRKK